MTPAEVDVIYSHALILGAVLGFCIGQLFPRLWGEK